MLITFRPMDEFVEERSGIRKIPPLTITKRKNKLEILKPSAPLTALKPTLQREIDALNLFAEEKEEEHQGVEGDASCCRALLLEILRRAAYDWVLYRTSSKLQDKQLADDAYYWLFVETKESSTWENRKEEGKVMTAFLTICDILDLDPEKVRAHIRQLTVRHVMSVGRPAERRYGSAEELVGDEHTVHSVSIDSIPYFDPTFGSGG